MKETAETLGVDFDPDFIKHLKKIIFFIFGYSFCFHKWFGR